jgi:hypothetical protein
MSGSLPLVLLSLVGSTIAIAACGSSTKVKAAGSARPQALAYVDCLRSHGVPNMPDPGPGGGIQLSPNSGINLSSPALKAAQAHCAKLLPGGEPSGGLGPQSEQINARLLAVSKCMRAHGLSDFPDPTVGPPPPSPQQFAIAIGSSGVSLLVPKTIDVRSPAFKQAATSCHIFGALGPGQRSPAR